MSGYHSTGNGGWFFHDIYTEAYSLETIRKTPCTIKEFEQVGLDSTEISQYFSLIKQLYGELFLKTNSLLPEGVARDTELIWNRLYEFCITHSLVIEFANEQGVRFYPRLPLEIELFDFLTYDKKCPGITLVDTFDNFRLVVEMSLADLPYGWYLSLRYNVSVVCYTDKEEPYDCLARYDATAKEMVKLSELESLSLLRIIKNELNQIDRKIIHHDCSAPEANKSSHEWSESCIQWLKKYVELQNERVRIEECEEIVANIIDSGVHIGVIETYPDDTLYVHKGMIKCQQDHHHIAQATAVLQDKNGNNIELNVCHCVDCQKFFIHYDLYKRYRKRYGSILGNIHMAKGGEFSKFGYDLADESPLRLCGYSVNEEENLPQWERQSIIASCIENGAMTKESVIRLLRWFVEVNGKKKGNESACAKWCADLDFAQAYNTPKQEKYRIRDITIYRKNHFLVK